MAYDYRVESRAVPGAEKQPATLVKSLTDKTTAIVNPMVEAGIVREDEIKTATAVVVKNATGQDLTNTEAAVDAKMKTGKKKSMAVPAIIATIIGYMALA